jgi:hypothetical protein
MPKSWLDIRVHFSDAAHACPRLQGMLRLVQQIEASPYVEGVNGVTSMNDLLIIQQPSSDLTGPHLRISAAGGGAIEFRYVDTGIKTRQWHRIVAEEQAFSRLESFFEQLHWFAVVQTETPSLSDPR